MLEAKNLADYTLEERKTDLTWAMTAIGARLEWVKGVEHMPTLRFALDCHGFDDPMLMDVRIMLNQWDVLVHGANKLEEGHARGSAKDVSWWLLSSAQLGPKDRPPCQYIVDEPPEPPFRCDYLNADFHGGRWLCLSHAEDEGFGPVHYGTCVDDCSHADSMFGSQTKHSTDPEEVNCNRCLWQIERDLKEASDA